MIPTARFRLEKVSRIYRQRSLLGRSLPLPALQGVDWEIAERRITGLLGASGAGKSTLARLLVGLERPDDGRILFRGLPLEHYAVAVLRRQNQIMFQNALLAVNALWRVDNIVAEPLRILGIAAGEIRRRVAELFTILEMSPALLIRRPDELSGGQLQRVVLARAMILNPEFLILDEPFAALDEGTAFRLLRHCSDLFRRLEIGVLLISHDLRQVRAVADEAAVMWHGRIVEQGPAFELFTAPQHPYSRLLLSSAP